MHRLRAAVIAFVLASVPANPGQQTPDPGATLQRTGERLLADLDRMPRYTCIQTITRTYYDTPSKFHQPACSALIAEHDKRKRTLPTLGWDRLRLDVAFVEGGSIYSWVGAPRFTDDTLDELAGQGPLGSGDFGGFLSEVLRRTTLAFQREEVIGGRRLLEYAYEMPLNKTTYKVKTSKGWELTAYSGTLLLDPDAADIVRLTVRTAELPPESAACQGTSEVTYGRTRIHEHMVLVPRETRLYGINLSGNESLSQTVYANCREYASTVRLLFDGAKASEEPAATQPAPEEPPAPLPAGLQFDARIITPIDSDTAAAGDPIEAVLRSAMRGEHKAVIAPAGAHLHGRLRRVKWWTEPSGQFQITVQFESVEIGGKNVPLSAALYPPRKAMIVGAPSHMMLLKPDDPSLGGSFFFHEDRVLRKQLDAEWVTVAPATERDKQ